MVACIYIPIIPVLGQSIVSRGHALITVYIFTQLWLHLSSITLPTLNSGEQEDFYGVHL